MDTIAHIAGESPVVYAEKEFDRFMKSYEFAIEAQKLKREDVRDLVELIVSRMDMYHLVGALLLEFCVAFYGETKLLEEGYREEPCFILEIFLLSNICAIGYLLFAVWLSLHASVAAHAIGVEFLLESSRLTIPSPENLKQMRESTSVFRHIYQIFQDPRNATAGLGPSGTATPLTSQAPRQQASASSSAIVPIGEYQTDFDTRHIRGQGLPLTGGPGKLPLALDQDMDTMEHRYRFAQSHRCWLRFDAYSRVCMALGINQMLQALSYFIVGPVQQKRPSSALISLIAVQAIALLLLKLDLRNTEAEAIEGTGDGNESDHSEESQVSKFSFMEIGSKDVSVASCRDLALTLSTFSLAPLWTTLGLWANRFTRHVQLLSLSVTPCFFLHAMWLFLVLRTISPHEGDLLPLRLRTVGYLDIFTKDVLDPDEFETDSSVVRKRRSRGRSDISDGVSEDGSLMGGSRRGRKANESLRPLRTLTTTLAMQKEAGEKPHHHHSRSAESVPWLVVKRFTLTMIVLWVIGGFVHFAHTLDNSFEEYTVDRQQEEAEEEELNGGRRLRAVWPEPAGFFEVTALHCNSSHVTFSSPFALHSARRLEDEAALGPLFESGSPDAHSVMCRQGGDCNALVLQGGSPTSGGTAAQPESMEFLSESAANHSIPLPHEWRLATGAWLPCEPQPCEAGVLAGWDGSRIVIADLWRESAGSSWSLDPRFAVRPSPDKQACDAAPHRRSRSQTGGGCSAAEPPAYAGVQAMQLSAEGRCQTLTVLLRNGTLDGWDLIAGTKIGTWRLNRTFSHTTMCHDGQDLFLTHPGEGGGPVVETVPLPEALANCTAAGDDAYISLAKQTILEEAKIGRFLTAVA